MGEERLEDKWIELYFCGADHKTKTHEGRLGDFEIPEVKFNQEWLDDFNNFGRISYHFSAEEREEDSLLYKLELLVFLRELEKHGIKYRTEEGRYDFLTSDSKGRYITIVKEGD